MTDLPDHYAALGIDPTADQEVIGAAYRALAKKYHPDTGATTGTASAERFAEIQQAYEVLGSAENRKRYDQELLEATQRELDEHLARKQRKIAGSTSPSPPTDLGTIRPERRSRGRADGSAVSVRQMGPFLVITGLLMAVAGGFAGLYLKHAPVAQVAETPPPPPVASTLAPPPQETTVSASATTPDAAPKPATAPVAAPAPEATQQAALPEERPLFGTSLMDEPAEAPAAAEEIASVAPPPPPVPPIPKAKPPAAPAEADAEGPIQTAVRSARYTVVIYEKYRTGDIIQDEGRVLFVSQARCAAFGERAVLRRLAPYEGQRQRPRIWYECIEAR